MDLTPAISRKLLRSAVAMACSSIIASCGGTSSGGDTGRSAPSFSIGGTFTGLSQGSITVGVGLDTRVIPTQGDGVIRDITFVMPSKLPSGASYDLQILSTDSNVTCEVQSGSGVVAGADITNIVILCFSIPSLRLLAGRIPKPDVDGIATDIAFQAKTLAVGADGTIYLGADTGRGAQLPLIRRITPTGFLTTIAGGNIAAADGQGSAAGLIRPRGLAFTPDGTGTLLFADRTAVRRITTGGAVTTFAGSLTQSGTADTPLGAVTPDPLAARFVQIDALVLAGDGTIYVADTQTQPPPSTFTSALRKITADGRVSTLATIAAQINKLAFGLDGQLYASLGPGIGAAVARLRLGAGGVTVETLATPAKPLLGPVVAMVPETATSLIAVTTLFGQLARFYTDGRTADFISGGDGTIDVTKCVDGRLSGPQVIDPDDMIALAPGKLLIADDICQSLRLVDLGAGRMSTLYGSLGFGTADGSGPTASFHGLSGLAFDPISKRLATTEVLGLLVRKVGVGGAVTTLVGDPTNTHPVFATGTTFADGAAATATFATPSAIVSDGSGGFFLLDQLAASTTGALRRVDSNGSVTTLRSDVPLKNGAARAQPFQQYMAMDSSGRFIVPSGNAIWRFGQTGAPQSIAGTGTAGFADSPAPPQFSAPSGIVIAKDGTIFVADTGNSAIRRIATDGTVSTVAGGTVGPSGAFTAPVAVALTENENFLLVLDNQQFVVKAIDLRPGTRSALRTIVGTAGVSVLALGPLPGSLAPPYQCNCLGGPLRSTEWDTHALLVRGSTLYIALGDAILEADLALH
jgi:sugar lactone lactonase YvrE